MSLLEVLSIQAPRKIRIGLHRSVALLRTALIGDPSADTPYCAACERHCAAFIDWKASYRRAICPRCFAFPRHRLLSRHLREAAEGWTDETTMLHFAPEPSLQRFLRPRLGERYTTADLHRRDVDRQVDVTRIPFDDDTFDVVLCDHVLEHVPDDRAAMREILRVLKPGGWASLMVPMRQSLAETYEDFTITSPRERLKHFGQEDHVRWYGPDYLDRLRESGFEVECKNYTAVLAPAELERLGLRPDEELFIGWKGDSEPWHPPGPHPRMRS
jgi:SAM-dependent methyltransferase